MFRFPHRLLLDHRNKKKKNLYLLFLYLVLLTHQNVKKFHSSFFFLFSTTNLHNLCLIWIETIRFCILILAGSVVYVLSQAICCHSNINYRDRFAVDGKDMNDFCLVQLINTVKELASQNVLCLWMDHYDRENQIIRWKERRNGWGIGFCQPWNWLDQKCFNLSRFLHVIINACLVCVPFVYSRGVQNPFNMCRWDIGGST